MTIEEEYAAHAAQLFEKKDRRDTDTVYLLLDAISEKRADRVQYLLDLGQTFLNTSAMGLVVHGGDHVFSQYMSLDTALVFVRYYNNAPESTRLQFGTVIRYGFRVSAFVELAKSAEHTTIASQFFISICCIPLGACGRVLVECGRAKVYQTDTKDVVREIIRFIDSEQETDNERLERHECQKTLLTASQELLETCKDLKAQNIVLQEQVKTLDTELKSSQMCNDRIRRILCCESVKPAQ